MSMRITFKGGPGSGHRGHAGRPGKRGGSMPGIAGSGGVEDVLSVQHTGRGYWAIEGVLDSQKIERLRNIQGSTTVSVNLGGGKSASIVFRRWIKYDKDRLYANVTSGPGWLRRDSKLGFVDLNTGSISLTAKHERGFGDILVEAAEEL